MPLSSEETKSISFNVPPRQGEWIVGNQPACLVVTEGNWSTHYSNTPDGADLRRFVYAVVSLGTKPNAGHTVTTRQIERAKDTITVRVEINEPDPQKMYAQVLVHPIAVAAIARADLGPPYPSSFVFVDQKGRRLATVRAEL